LEIITAALIVIAILFVFLYIRYRKMTGKIPYDKSILAEMEDWIVHNKGEIVVNYEGKENYDFRGKSTKIQNDEKNEYKNNEFTIDNPHLSVTADEVTLDESGELGLSQNLNKISYKSVNFVKSQRDRVNP
jgi:hypothetical protein